MGELFAMHGYEFERVMDVETVKEIQTKHADLPGWPEAGSIIETEDYIVVHFK